MKIQSIQNYNTNKKYQTKNNYFNVSATNISPNNSKNYSLTFKAGATGIVMESMTRRNLNILGRSQNELIDLAESFHKASNKVISNISKQYSPGKGFFSGMELDSEKTNLAYTRVSSAIQEVKNKKSYASSYEVWRLDEKAKKCYKEYMLWNLGGISKEDVCP